VFLSAEIRVIFLPFMNYGGSNYALGFVFFTGGFASLIILKNRTKPTGFWKQLFCMEANGSSVIRIWSWQKNTALPVCLWK
jgi:hypothetical protein